MASITEVVDLTKAGKDPKEVATELGVRVNAVYQHLARARKTGLLPPSKGSRRSKRTRTPRAAKPAPTPVATNGHVELPNNDLVLQLPDNDLILLHFNAQEAIRKLDERRFRLIKVVEAIEAAAEPVAA